VLSNAGTLWYLGNKWAFSGYYKSDYKYSSSACSSLTHTAMHAWVVQVPALKQRVRRFWQQRGEAGNLGPSPGEEEEEDESAGGYMTSMCTNVRKGPHCNHSTLMQS
jgi:hypothetical protein